MRKLARENTIDNDGAIDFQEPGRIVCLVQAGKPVANQTPVIHYQAVSRIGLRLACRYGT
jgi:hypothetical protein